MKQKKWKRILSIFLVLSMFAGCLPPIETEAAKTSGLTWKEVDMDIQTDFAQPIKAESENDIPDVEDSKYSDEDMVRVSIVLDEKSTLQAGFSASDISNNAIARAYNNSLLAKQKTMADKISTRVLNDEALDVVWNITFLGNMISANIPYGKIKEIKKMVGIKNVVLEQRYEKEDTIQQDINPNTFGSSQMTGVQTIWSNGYTGAGMKIAIIDTGTDTNHQSFSNDAYLYSLEQNAKKKNQTLSVYKDSLDLMTTDDIAKVLVNLNAYERGGADTARLYLNEKLPFAYNYVDGNYTVDHDSDNQGSHGSHVAGIAAANRYIPSENGYQKALEAVYMQGIAPDAQILTMKVFGNADGPYDSDYFSAMEDAVMLGADAVNLSLGSNAPGMADNPYFAEFLEELEKTDAVVSVAGGNAYAWAETTPFGYLYKNGVNYDTIGAPGSYENSFTVASVNNIGVLGNYFSIKDQKFFYTETRVANQPMSSLDISENKNGTTYKYVFIDGVGKEEDYAGIDLNGKIVFVSRGYLNYAYKGSIAAELGAAGLVCYNNESGSFSLNLSDYTYTTPYVSISDQEGKAIRELSTENVTEAGLKYYTGTITVYHNIGTNLPDKEYNTMSSFSSWGVPGDLSLKPEITAPGGGIYSVNGMEETGTAYETLSGTSMSSPHVAGMSALVIQYLEENGIAKKEGLTVRNLAHSLLMSTAEPLREEDSGGNYYSILKQGAGLAHVDKAINAESYIQVEGQEDGKVKVELGDDPTRSGVYNFTFTIHNISGKDMAYDLNVDMFTQKILDNSGLKLLDKETYTLPVSPTFSSDGKSLETASGLNTDFVCDLNGDSITNIDDADYLLEYVLDNTLKLHADGDLNDDDVINTYDAHLFLANQGVGYAVEVPANESVTVDVSMELTDAVKTYLNSNYPKGAYIEAFVTADPVIDKEEEMIGVSHSIPVLGYYGNWTEPSMFDEGNWIEVFYRLSEHYPYLKNEGGLYNNYFGVTYADSNKEILFGGNPIIDDEYYIPERNAFNNKAGNKLSSLTFGLIRNAANSKLEVIDNKTGEIYFSETVGEVGGAYYNLGTGRWDKVQQRLRFDLELSNIPEGRDVTIRYGAAPEYYVTGYNSSKEMYDVNWDNLSDGAYLGMSFRIDNTAPEASEIVQDEADPKLIHVKVKDNNYVSAVQILNTSGNVSYAATAVDQRTPNTAADVALKLDTVFANKFLVAVYDYAANYTVYEVEFNVDTERPYFTAIDVENVNADGTANYVGFDTAAVPTYVLEKCSGRSLPVAATYVDGYVFEITKDNKLYVSPDGNLADTICIGDIDSNNQWWISSFVALAYNMADKQLYGLFKSDLNENEIPYLCTIDMFTGQLKNVGVMPIDAETLAIDKQGNFYSSVFYYEDLYTYQSDVIETGVTKLVGKMGNYKSTSPRSMAWDHNKDTLYYLLRPEYKSESALLQINTENAGVTVYNNKIKFNGIGLYIPYIYENGGMFAPVNKIESFTLPELSKVLVNNTIQLEAEIRPWNVENKAVKWTSSDMTVATVNQEGVVKGLKEGTAVITATSVLDSTVSASCKVSVVGLDKELNGIIWDENRQVWWSKFNINNLTGYTKMEPEKDNLPFNSTMIVDGILYGSTINIDALESDLYKIDLETYETTKVGTSWYAYMDMAPMPSYKGYALATFGQNVLLVDLKTGNYVSDMNIWDNNLVGITYYGTIYDSVYGYYKEYYLLLDNQGNVYLQAFCVSGSNLLYYSNEKSLIGNIGKAVNAFCYQDLYFDGEYTYWTRFDPESNKVEFILWDSEVSGNTYSLGCFPDNVWPVSGLYMDADLTSMERNGKLIEIAESLGTNSISNNVNVEKNAPKKAADTGKIEKLINESSDQQVSAGTLQSYTPFSVPTATKNTDDLMTVELEQPGEGANGRLTLDYDESALELISINGKTTAFAYKDKGGSVDIAYATANVREAGSKVASVNFKKIGDTTGAVSSSHKEFGEQVFGGGSATYSVSGTVTSSGNEKDLVKIELSGKDDPMLPSYTCYGSGNSFLYALDNVPAGAYTMTVSKANHLTQEVDVVITDGNVTQDVKLKLGSGGVEFRIGSANLNLSDDITVRYHAVIPEGFEEPYMVFTFNGKEYRVDEYKINASTGRYVFSFEGITPQRMGDNISAVLYAKCGDDQVSASVQSYSARQYCKGQLEKSTNEKLTRLLSDLLIYGEQSQLYSSYKTDELVTEGLKLSPSKFETLGAEYDKLKLDGETSTEADWSGASLYLANDMAIKLSIKTESPEKYTYDITINGRTNSYTHEDLVQDEKNPNKYYLYFSGIMATEFDMPVTGVIKKDGVQVGRKVTYSVNTYIQKNQDKEGLAGIVQAIYNYGNSASDYVK